MKQEQYEKYTELIETVRDTIMEYIRMYQPTYYNLPEYIEQILWPIVERVLEDENDKRSAILLENAQESTKQMFQNMEAFLEYNQKKSKEITDLQEKLAALTTIKNIKVDDELTQYLDEDATAAYTTQEIVTILAKIPGARELGNMRRRANWHWVVELTNQRFAHTEAWSVFWESGEPYLSLEFEQGSTDFEGSAEKAALQASLCDEHGREIRKSLLAQLREEEPYGYVSQRPWHEMIKGE